MKRFFVVATKWSNEYNAQIKYIAGVFTEYNLARIFKEAYNEHYHTDETLIYDDWSIINR